MKALALKLLPWVVVGLLALAGWNEIAAHIPFTPQWTAKRNATSLDTAKADAAARSLEVTGEREQAQRVDTYSHVLIETQAIASEGMAEARSAPDASTPLDPDRSARLRRIDDGLCAARPTLSGCPAPAGDSEGG